MLDAQLRVDSVAPIATGKRPLARTVFQLSRICQLSVSPWVGRAVKTIANGLPAATRCVPSLGVSASSRSPFGAAWFCDAGAEQRRPCPDGACKATGAGSGAAFAEASLLAEA